MQSKKKKSVTGKRIAELGEVNIKPSKARQIIRNFHLLINKRKIICDKLGITLVDNDEPQNIKIIDNYLDNISRKMYNEGLHSTSSADMQSQLLKVQDNCISRDELLKSLGYVMHEVFSRGGLKDYQLASRIGQSNNRGGDSSKMLVSWMKELGKTKADEMKALEIGSLNCKNCISTCGIFNHVTRIDLDNANDTRGILRQDFMERPLPKDESEQFDLISCSLVLNFVPTPTLRGDMLKRFKPFLRKSNSTYVFIVLPLPCINNSRYLNKTHFTQIMHLLGYRSKNYHEAKKVCYFLFQLRQNDKDQNHSQQPYTPFNKKLKVNDGPRMNNFCILL